VAAFLLVATSSISCTKITVAGVMVVFETDGTLDPDTLHVRVTSDAGKTLLDWCYSATASPPFFPTTLAIASDGNPGASVTITASVLRAGVTLDVRQNLVTLVPTDHLAELDIVFSARCTAQVGLMSDPQHGTNCASGLAASLCQTGSTCDPRTGMCTSDVVSGPMLPIYPAGLDGGSSASVALGNDAGDAEAEAEGSSPSAEAASGEASSAEGSTADAAEAGGQVPEPHCAPGGPGLTNCGLNKESCCTNYEVTGGAFYRTYDLDPLGGADLWIAPDGGAVGLDSPATLSTFRLDKYDVTVGRFRQFVDAWNGGGGFNPPAGSGKHTHLNGGAGLVDVGGPADAGTVYETGWNPSDNSSVAPTNANLACDPEYPTWTAAAGKNENLPINCVTWAEAYAFCIWDGGFLPSEAEWEYAAAGGNQQRTYPWGSADPGTASEYAIYGCYYPSGPPGFKCTGLSNIAPVGTAPLGAGLFGQVDLAGEMYQFNLDWYASYGFGDDDGGMGQYLPGAPCTDCANLTEAFGRVVRGGNFLEDDTSLLAPFRNFFYAAPDGDRDPGVGFRCARSP
jgi:formylglycine-generating enzyme required for sulfatase activity